MQIGSRELNKLKDVAEINCNCGKCGITLADGQAKLKFKCGCQDCRQALEWGHSKGAVKPDPLPDLLYMPSDIIDVRGRESMQSYQLRHDDPSLLGMSRRIYCTECYDMIGVDHPAYQDNVFLNFPKHCKNTGDLSVPLAAYVNMIDYTEQIGPMPTEDVPLFTTLRFEQEAKRIFGIPAVANAFCPREAPPEGITFSALIEETGGTEILGFDSGSGF